MNYRIVEKEAFRIVGVKEWTTLENGANFVNIPKMWENLPKEKFKQIGALANTEITGIIGVCADMYNNGFDYWIAAVTTKECPDDLNELMVSANTWAVVEAVGAMPDSIQGAWKHILSEWLPNSNYEHACAPEFEWYSDGNMQSKDYRCEVWIPVVKKG